MCRYHYSPSPDRYEKRSEFENSPKKGITISVGREDCKNVSIFNTSKYPAPTDYNVVDKENSPGYSIRPKVKLPSMFPDIRTPGPGHCTYFLNPKTSASTSTSRELLSTPSTSPTFVSRFTKKAHKNSKNPKPRL